MLFEPISARSLNLRNRMVMAPMTRSRAAGNIPNAMMADYYGQRATAGLIVTEGTSPSPNGLGYPAIPGLFSQQQAAGWKTVTDAVHAKGGKIFVQLMHTGRVCNLANMPAGAEVLGPVAEVCPGQINTGLGGMQPHSPARAMTEQDIARTVGEYAEAGRLAMSAGFDGVELHGANGYLIDQFLNANVNRRSDGYGGSVGARNRFALEVVRAMVAAVGADRVGIRLSPYGVFNSTGPFPEIDAQYVALAEELSAIGILYIHQCDHSAMGAPPVPAEIKAKLRAAFKGIYILASGFDRASAEAALAEKRADLIAFGRPFIANPDLVERLRRNSGLNAPDMATFYGGGAKGFTDYPTIAA